MAIVGITDVGNWLHLTVDVDTAILVIRAAEAWLQSATRLVVWPDPVPENLWAWATELAALAYSNPEILTHRATGGVSQQWNRTFNRKAEILEAAKAYYDNVGTPRGAFPVPLPYPEPTDRYAFPFGRIIQL